MYRKIQFISNDSPSITFIEEVQDILDKKITQLNFQSAKLDTVAIHKAQSNINISLSKASGEESLKGLNEIKIAIGGAFGYLIMMFIVQEAIRSGIMDGMKELNIRIIWHLLLSQPEKYHMLQVLEKVN